MSKIFSLILVSPLLFMPLYIKNIAYAQQSNTLTITPYILITTPDSIFFPTTFYDLTLDNTLYLPTDPDNSDERILVADRRDAGGFTVTVSINSFTAPTGNIHLSSLGLLTLAQASPDTVDTSVSPANIPPGTDSGTVTAPLDCDWDFTGDFGTACDTKFLNFIESGTPDISNPVLILDGSSPTGPGRNGVYWLSPGFRLIIPTGTLPGDYLTTITYSLILT